jgi:hypothetical protein
MRKRLIKWLTPLKEEDKQMNRINFFLDKNGLKIEDLKKMLEIVLQNKETL